MQRTYVRTLETTTVCSLLAGVFLIVFSVGTYWFRIKDEKKRDYMLIAATICVGLVGLVLLAFGAWGVLGYLLALLSG